ncbi:hypothetical protein [Streptomyces sp. NPDC003032]
MSEDRRGQAVAFDAIGHHCDDGMPALAEKDVPAAEFRQIDIADLTAGGPAGIGRFDGIARSSAVRPGGLMQLSMAEAGLDGAVIPFPGHTIRVSGYLRDSYAPAGSGISPSSQLRSSRGGPGPEHQVSLHCRRG